MIRVSDYVVKYLANIGISKIFTVSGGGSIFLCDALHKNKKIKYISCHHEQAVAFAAEGYARHSNNIGGAIVTTGPGGTNAITGVASCWIDSIPVIFISGQVFLNQTIGKTKLRQLGVQEINIIDLVKPITKYAETVKDKNDIKVHLDKCLYFSKNERFGPVWLDIPANIQSSYIDEKKLKSFIPKLKTKKTSVIKYINIATSMIRNSKKPLILLGHGVKLSNSQNIYKKIINNFKIPFCLTWNASSIIESNNEFFMGRPGAFAERGTNFIIQNCDLILCVGTRLPFMVTGYNSKKFAKNAKIIMVDIDESELDKKSLNLDLKIKSDAKDFAEILYKKLNVNKKINYDDEWLNYCKNIRKKYPIVLDEYKKQKKYVNSYFFIELLSKKLKTNDSIITDMGLSFVGTHQTFIAKKNQKLFTNSGHAPMGWGLPAAIGSYFASKKENIICITGEGGLQMNIQEFATVQHHKIPLKIFIYNNGGYLTIKQTQQLGMKSRIMGSDKNSGLSFPNYKKIADAHEIKYIKISEHNTLIRKLSSILSSNKSVICELIINPEQDQKPKAINRRINGKSVATDFEDLYPFLPKKELIKNQFKNFKTKEKK